MDEKLLRELRKDRSSLGLLALADFHEEHDEAAIANSYRIVAHAMSQVHRAAKVVSEFGSAVIREDDPRLAARRVIYQSRRKRYHRYNQDRLSRINIVMEALRNRIDDPRLYYPQILDRLFPQYNTHELICAPTVRETLKEEGQDMEGKEGEALWDSLEYRYINYGKVTVMQSCSKVLAGDSSVFRDVVKTLKCANII